MTSGTTPGGGIVGLRPRSHARAVTVRDLKSLPPMPSGSVYVFKPSDLSNPLFDKPSVFELPIVSLISVPILAVALFVLLFVKT